MKFLNLFVLLVIIQLSDTEGVKVERRNHAIGSDSNGRSQSKESVSFPKSAPTKTVVGKSSS